MNVVTKSGGNQFHGDGFAYYDSTGHSRRVAQFKFWRFGHCRDASRRRSGASTMGLDIGGFISEGSALVLRGV